jgi:hypothetical protein
MLKELVIEALTLEQVGTALDEGACRIERHHHCRYLALPGAGLPRTDVEIDAYNPRSCSVPRAGKRANLRWWGQVTGPAPNDDPSRGDP